MIKIIKIIFIAKNRNTTEMLSVRKLSKFKTHILWFLFLIASNILLILLTNLHIVVKVFIPILMIVFYVLIITLLTGRSENYKENIQNIYILNVT
jgi:cell division protein FtsW (lipid II flippase)